MAIETLGSATAATVARGQAQPERRQPQADSAERQASAARETRQMQEAERASQARSANAAAASSRQAEQERNAPRETTNSQGQRIGRVINETA